MKFDINTTGERKTIFVFLISTIEFDETFVLGSHCSFKDRRIIFFHRLTVTK